MDQVNDIILETPLPLAEETGKKGYEHSDDSSSGSVKERPQVQTPDHLYSNSISEKSKSNEKQNSETMMQMVINLTERQE